MNNAELCLSGRITPFSIFNFQHFNFSPPIPRENYILTSPPDGDNLIRVDGTESGHLVRVLRARVGDHFTAFDGAGHGWQAEIVSIQGTAVVARPLASLEEPPPCPAITIAVAAIKSARMDWAVEKAAELGAARFIPLETDFSVVEPGSGKIARWRTIALSAAKQTRQLYLMDVADPMTFSALISSLKVTTAAPLLFFDEHLAGESVANIETVLRKAETAVVLIGPEGGWSADEVSAVVQAGGIRLSLGRRIVRTETAVAVALGLLSR